MRVRRAVAEHVEVAHALDDRAGLVDERVILSAVALGCGILVRPALAPATALFGALVVGAGILHSRGKVSLRALWPSVAFGAAVPFFARSDATSSSTVR